MRKLIVAVTLLCLTSAAYAHAIALSSTPAQHEAVSGPDVAVKVQFNSRIDAKRSTLILVTPEGGRRALAIKEAAARDALVSQAKGLKSGSYVLRWQVLASDGHITRGEVPFSVK
jgi:methionine-rich copper-binding protein CopC